MTELIALAYKYEKAYLEASIYEYLYQWCRTQNSSDVSIDELLPQFLSSLKTIARVVRPVR